MYFKESLIKQPLAKLRLRLFLVFKRKYIFDSLKCRLPTLVMVCFIFQRECFCRMKNVIGPVKLHEVYKTTHCKMSVTSSTLHL